MGEVPQTQQGYPGQQTTTDDKSDGSMHRFAIEQILGRVNTAMLVQVKKVTNKGEVKEVGQVDVQPLAKMMDGEGGTFSHGVINDLPYFRLQGGSDKAIIMDPKEGDIGVAVFADRDISSVKATKKESNPASFRRFDMADGMFFPCFLGGKPTCYVRFTDDNKIITSPDDGKTLITVEANKVRLETTTLEIVLRPDKIFLGSEVNATHAVMTIDGPSAKVFSVIAENK